MNNRAHGQTVVAVVLAVGLAAAINVVVAAVLYDAIRDPSQAGLSENATQILTTAFGGIVGVLGGFIGYQAGAMANGNGPVADDADAAEADELGDGDGGPVRPVDGDAEYD